MAELLVKTIGNCYQINLDLPAVPNPETRKSDYSSLRIRAHSVSGVICRCPALLSHYPHTS